MNKDSFVVDLKPNPLLLDRFFEGYKLSLEPLPIYRKQIALGVHVVQPNDDQFSFFHVKEFSLHNHLHVNPHKPDDVYYVDKHCKIHKVTFSSLDREILVKEVLQFSNFYVKQMGNYNISIAFPSPETVLISNGAGDVYMAKINEVQGKEKWEVLESSFTCKKELPCRLSDTRLEMKNGNNLLHILLLQIEEKNREESNEVKTGLFQTVLKWKTFTQVNGESWQEKGLKKLSIDGYVDYVALELGCKSIYIVCDKSPQWLSDSENTIKEANNVEEEMKLKLKKLYSWTQSDSKIILWPLLPANITNSDFEISVEDSKMEVKVNNEQFVGGNFFQKVNKDESNWYFEKNKLEVHLTKQESGLLWKSLFMDDDERGEEIKDSDLVASIHDKLSHSSSDKEENVQPSFNAQQLEECDAVSCSSTSLMRIDGEKHFITHKASLSSSQWLFNVNCDPTQTPAVCCRHDVDACIWQFKECTDSEKTWPNEHLGTFSAFGYVQASKTQKKFIVSPPNLSYAAICEASHHIYIYRQPSPLSSELKNRQTGKKVNTISKQQLINLETNEQILGVHATNTIMYLLLENSICVLIIND